MNFSETFTKFLSILLPFFVARVVFAVAFAGISVGQSMAFLPDYAKARHSADLILHLFTIKPLIDNYSKDGVKPVRNSIQIYIYWNQ